MQPDGERKVRIRVGGGDPCMLAKRSKRMHMALQMIALIPQVGPRVGFLFVEYVDTPDRVFPMYDIVRARIW